MRRILFGLCFLSFLNIASGQEIPLPEKMPQTHPRVLTTPAGKQETWKLIKKEEWAPYLQSVVIFGRCHLLDGGPSTMAVLKRFMMKYYLSEQLAEEEIARSGKAVQLFEITVEHLSGKEVQER